MWATFVGKDFDRDGFAAYVVNLRWVNWRPKGITLHNTAAPTLAQWAESGPSHDARIRNLQRYYEEDLGWHAGPHLFISRTKITVFSSLTATGIHSRCFNNTHLGIEMVGDYSREEFHSGDGALVRDNTVFALATLYKALGLDPSGLAFHRDCKLDNHACPGDKVDKADIIPRVRAAMSVAKVALQEAPVVRDAKWVQARLNALGATPALTVDGDLGPKSVAAMAAFIEAHQKD